MRGQCPIPLEERGACPVFEREGRCWSDTHHLFFYRHLYKTNVEEEFRNLPDNKVQLPRCQHNEIHATQSPPEKPSLVDMRLAIELSKLAVKEAADI